MSWPRDCLFKHDNNTNVAFQMLTSFWIPEKRVWKLKVRWWNVGVCHAPWNMNVEQNIVIPLSACPSWKRLEMNARVPHTHMTLLYQAE